MRTFIYREKLSSFVFNSAFYLGTRQPYMLEYSIFLRFLYVYHTHAVANFLHIALNQTGQDRCDHLKLF
jgi:hypothetical protein